MKILVATHKDYWMAQDSCYLPLHVGREGKVDLGFAGDNSGDNISTKNFSFNELTGLYWAWKNLNDEDYIGLCHYRRYFANGHHFSKEGKRSAVFSEADYRHLLQKADVILPKPRNYFIETTRTQFEHIHNPEDLKVVEKIIACHCPEYLEAFETVMNRTSGHRFNMFVMKREILESYCQWLFSILFELERRIDISGYDVYNKRVFGFIGERLLDVWILKNNIKYVEHRVLFLEDTNWFLKIYKFLKRKIKGGDDSSTFGK